LAPTSALSFQVLSPNIFFFSNKKKNTHTHTMKKKTIKKKKMQKKEGTYLFSNIKKEKKT
jgi:hypothetical protein